MNNDNVNKAASIIDKLVNSTRDEEMSETVRDNILTTVDSVHSGTEEKEIAKGTTAQK